MTAPRFSPGVFRPDPAPADRFRTLIAASGLELKMLLRNGEQLLLALVIPVVVLVGLTKSSVIALTAPRVEAVVPGVIALALMSAAFTSQAITTGFDRRYGVLKRLAAAGVSKGLMTAGKAGAVVAVVVGQVVILCVIGLLLGWRPHGDPASALLLLVLAIAAFTGMALQLGGTLRAEAVLALANLIWLVMVLVGGVIVPLDKSPGWLKVIGELTPAGALSDGLRSVLEFGRAPGIGTVLVLLVWIAIGWAGTVRWFRWQ